MRAAAVKQLGRAVKHAADGEHRQRAAKRLHNKKPRIRAFTVSFPQRAFFYAKTAGKSFRRRSVRAARGVRAEYSCGGPAFFQNKSASRPRGRSKSRTKPKTAQKGPARPSAKKERRPSCKGRISQVYCTQRKNAVEAQDDASRNRKMAHHALCQAYGAGRSSAIFGHR